MTDVRKVRYLIEYKGVIRKVFKIAIVKKDASLYIFPYGTSGKYYYGKELFYKNQISKTFNYKSQYYSTKRPTISIHQSGQSHIRIGRDKIDVQINSIPLKDFRGEHIATITCHSLDSLIEYKKTIKTTGSEIDDIIPCGKGIQNLRYAIYLNAQSPNFKVPCGKKRVLTGPMFLGLSPFAMKPIGEGITIITGWDISKNIIDEDSFLFIHAE